MKYYKKSKIKVQIDKLKVELVLHLKLIARKKLITFLSLQFRKQMKNLIKKLNSNKKKLLKKHLL